MSCLRLLSRLPLSVTTRTFRGFRFELVRLLLGFHTLIAAFWRSRLSLPSVLVSTILEQFLSRSLVFRWFV